jgi:prepilin-type N-terminal cleavage/methylation domain-containing protein
MPPDFSKSSPKPAPQTPTSGSATNPVSKNHPSAIATGHGSGNRNDFRPPHLRSPISDLRSSKRRAAAFTLIELLVVITIISILAGLVLAAMGGIQKRGARGKAEADIQALSAAIDEFYRDFGQYPQANSNTLFRELLGSNAVINSNSAKVYFEPTPGMIGTNSAGQNFFQDPWGNGYVFITSGPTLRNRGLFDLYSTAGNASSNQWIRN